MSTGLGMGERRSDPNQPTSDDHWVLVSIAVGALIIGCGAIVAAAVEVSRDGSLDPSLGTHMGSDALDFRVGLAYVTLPAALVCGGAFVLGRRVIRVQLVTCATLVALSTTLFYGLSGNDCFADASNQTENVVDFAVTGGIALLALVAAVWNRRNGASKADHGWTWASLTSVLVVVAYVQLWHCAGPSQQVGREFLAPMVGIVFGGLMVAVGTTVGWLISGRRRTD